MRTTLSRRRMIQFLGASAVASGLQLRCGPAAKPDEYKFMFLTGDEVSLLTALADTVLPPDKDGAPGAGSLGVAEYTDRLLSAFDSGGLFHKAGPFSDRGGAETNGFQQSVPLNRLSERAWRLYLFGSAAVEGGAPNEAELGPVVGLRDHLRGGLSDAKVKLGDDFAGKSAPARFVAFKQLDKELQQTLITLSVEACFAAPEYGGNKDLKGWGLIHFDGDSQPEGYTRFDDATGQYTEREDKPVSTPNPGDDPAPMDDDTRAFLNTIIAALGGRTAA